MPIVTVQVIGNAPANSNEALQQLADSLGSLFESEPGGTWVKFQIIQRDHYAENGIKIDSSIEPTFVEILKSELPETSELAIEAKSVAEIVGQVLSRPTLNVHVIYLPEGKGRVAFGGHLLV